MRRQVYQQSVLQLARRILEKQRATESERIDLPNGGDFGFNDPDGVLIWGPEYYLSNHHPGHLPRPGGMMAQTKAVQDDWYMLSTIFAHEAGEIDADQAAQAKIDEIMKSNVDYNR